MKLNVATFLRKWEWREL